jgi:hypothetical protein
MIPFGASWALDVELLNPSVCGELVTPLAGDREAWRSS